MQRTFFLSIWAAVFVSLLGAALSYVLKPEPIRVGVLHSQTGPMAISEVPVLQATLAAIGEVNARGGIDGRWVEAVVADGASDPAVFARELERLLVHEQVSVVFGGWTSASRKAMLPVLEQHDGLLFYPVQYEGLEQSAHVIYTGAAPNQQLVPAVSWMVRHLGKRVLLVGSDYIFPRLANAQARTLIESLGGEVCDEVYFSLTDSRLSGLPAVLDRCRADVVLNTLNGSSNVALFRLLRTPGRADVPVMSLSLAEPELRSLVLAVGAGATRAHYATWSYFQSLDEPENRRWLNRLVQRQVAVTAVSNPMASAAVGVDLWRDAVLRAQTTRTEEVRAALRGQLIGSPMGLVRVDGSNQHLWLPVFIGQAREDGQFDIVWRSHAAVVPDPWPDDRSPEEWQAVLHDWYRRWGQQWQAP